MIDAVPRRDRQLWRWEQPELQRYAVAPAAAVYIGELLFWHPASRQVFALVDYPQDELPRDDDAELAAVLASRFVGVAAARYVPIQWVMSEAPHTLAAVGGVFELPLAEPAAQRTGQQVVLQFHGGQPSLGLLPFAAPDDPARLGVIARRAVEPTTRAYVELLVDPVL